MDSGANNDHYNAKENKVVETKLSVTGAAQQQLTFNDTAPNTQMRKLIKNQEKQTNKKSFKLLAERQRCEWNRS